jgi:aspartokinase
LVFDLETREQRLALQITERLERTRLTFFQVNTKAAQTRFTVRPLKYRDVERMVREVIESRGVEARLNTDDFALVSVVGEALRRRLDAWDEQAERVLVDAGIELHGSNRDDISLSYLVSEGDRKKAVECLHRQLVL